MPRSIVPLIILFSTMITANTTQAPHGNNNRSNNTTKRTRAFLITIPKSGSKMLHKLFREMTDSTVPWIQTVNTHMRPVTRNMHIDPHSIQAIKNSEYTFSGHIYCTSEHRALVAKSDLVLIFLYRDPRDQLLSLLSSAFGKFVLPQLGLDPSVLLWEKNTAINYLICHIDAIYKRYIGWIDFSNTYAVRFEDLIGPQGGGSSQAQLQNILNIATHTGISVTQEQASLIANGLFGGTPTFHKGQIGTWKKEFTEEHKDLFKKHAGQLLIDLGYEEDMRW